MVLFKNMKNDNNNIIKVTVLLYTHYLTQVILIAKCLFIDNNSLYFHQTNNVVL